MQADLHERQSSAAQFLTGETEQRLSLLAREVWIGRRRDGALQERLLRDPAVLLEEHGIAIPYAFETSVTAGKDSLSFRFRPRNAPGDAGDGASMFTDGSLFFRYEFQWIWD